MRTFGRPDVSTVASAMPFASLISDAVASFSHASKSAKGSSPDVEVPGWVVALAATAVGERAVARVESGLAMRVARDGDVVGSSLG